MKPVDSKKTRASNVNLQALEVFCEVVRRRSFSRGAGAFGLSQSAASQLVAHLEQELGFRLVDRKRRPLEPTPRGQTYYLGCQELLLRHRSLVSQVLREDATVGTVRVVSIYSVGLHVLSGYIRRFLTRHRGSTVNLEYLHPNKVYSAVLAGEAELGVVSYPRLHRELESRSWLAEEMVLACPPDHRLASVQRVKLEELNGENFVAFDSDLVIRREVDRALEKQHVSVEVSSEFDNIETIKQALEIFDAVSILPRTSIVREVERGTLCEVSLEVADLIRPVGIIRHKKRGLTPTVERFLETLFETGYAPEVQEV